MAETVRTFIALELENSIQQFVHQIQNDLKNKIDGKIAWVKPENSHITLKFLGDTHQDQIQPIINSLGTIPKPNQSIDLTANQLGVFPSEGSPKIIWIGFEDPKNNVMSLFTTIETKLSKLGIAKEKRGFQNHLTLGRIKSLKDDEALRTLLYHEKLFENEKFRVASLTFFQSTLSSEGSIYTPIKSFAI